MELVVTMTKGLPGSGKSTWALDQIAAHKGGAKRISTDDLRAMMDAGTFSKKNERFMLQTRDALVRLALDQQRNVIVDATHLNPVHEARLQAIATEAGASFSVQDFTDVSVETCIERDLKRSRSVGERVIREMWAKWLAPKPPAYDPMLTECVIVDLDGTLANIGDRNPFDASTCETDQIRTEVFHAMLGASNGCEVMLFSGRSGLYREQTIRWLAAHDIEYDALHMRAPEDMRRDSDVKREMYEDHIKGRYNVKAVFDDRPQVIWECWRAIGLPVIDVGQGVWF